MAAFDDHFCHAIGCGRAVPPKMFMCRRHWYMLPVMYRNGIWNTYREGQEIDKQPSKEYINQASRAVSFIAHVEAGGVPEIPSLAKIEGPPSSRRVRFDD